MSPEQELLTKWRSLPRDKQEEVLDFVEFLSLKNSANKIPLGERLQQIRTKIVASGKHLLNYFFAFENVLPYLLILPAQ
ncbi:MAG TPA: hypothetical protein VE944_30625 [Nostoc sp.]|uniref:hypothetical protein n=1 Tax=Nostoc sp. TaxID=1180 RepID=UPI002D437421|nr:hypothetical protein [Nostoc sp.]HYX18646.1 hypothetical protein [Nostoc sp.]